MILLPAVDIRDGRAVRLRQGHFDDETVYADNPLEAARSFVEAGARFLHVVDLDGAREGEPASLEHLSGSCTSWRCPSSTAAGCARSPPCARALAAGAARVVLGTAAYTDPELLDRGARDVARPRGRGRGRARRPGVGGRLDEGDPERGEDVIERLQRRGVSASSTRTWTATGCSRGRTSTRCARIAQAVRGRFLYSGGIGSLEDLHALRELRLVNLAGVISGKALYEGRFTVARARPR